MKPWKQINNVESIQNWKKRLKTYFCARLGDGPEVVDHVGLGHTNTGITDGKDFVLLVRDDADVELLLRVQN